MESVEDMLEKAEDQLKFITSNEAAIDLIKAMLHAFYAKGLVDGKNI